MLNPPLSVLLSWPTPNYVNPVTRGDSLTGLSLTMDGFIVILVALRYYTRLKLTKYFGTDDVLIGLALVSSLGFSAATLLGNYHYGTSRHVWDIPYSDVTPLLKAVMVGKVFFTLASTLTRLSLLSFYSRLIKNTSLKKIKTLLTISQLLVGATGVTFLTITIFLCRPVRAYWTFPRDPNAHCIDDGTSTFAAGIVSCCLDLLVNLLPIPIVIKMQMPTRQRVIVMILLSLGFVATCAGIIRTYFVWFAMIATYDETWNGYPLLIAATVEIDLAIICACAPALRPLFMHYVEYRMSMKVKKTIPDQISASSDRRGISAGQSSAEQIGTNSTNSPLDECLVDTPCKEVEQKEASLWMSDKSPVCKGAGWTSGNLSMRTLITRNLEASYAESKECEV